MNETVMHVAGSIIFHVVAKAIIGKTIDVAYDKCIEKGLIEENSNK